jgi:hypothetical protein
VTGAVIRTQAPLIRSINDAPQVWARMWREQVRMGMIPFYMFVERDTRPAGLLRRTAGPRLPHLPRRLPERLGPVPHGAWAVHVGHPGQGVH